MNIPSPADESKSGGICVLHDCLSCRCSRPSVKALLSLDLMLLHRLHKILLQIVGLLKITHDEARSLKEQTLGTRAVWCVAHSCHSQ